jgi:hypothetical protein
MSKYHYNMYSTVLRYFKICKMSTELSLHFHIGKIWIDVTKARFHRR